MVVGSAGARAGLCQRCGELILIGQIGPFAGERQSGGRLLTSSELGPHSGRGRRAGCFIRMDVPGATVGTEEDRAAMKSAFSAFSPWLGPSAVM